MSELETRTVATAVNTTPFLERRHLADRIFKGALIFNGALTAFWLVMLATGGNAFFFGSYHPDRAAFGRVLGGVFFFYEIWGFIWYGIKTLLLKYFVHFSKEERRQAFSSRMKAPFEVAELVQKYSERRIRITDMIGRRGRFIILGMAGFYYTYVQVATDPSPGFATIALHDNLFDAVLTSWIFLAFYYANGRLAAAFYGPQSRVMDGVLARANCLLITTLWTCFKFVLVPIGTQLARVYSRQEFAVVFALIWGSYMVTDTLAEVGGSLFGRQRIRVRGIGDVNRKSIAGTVSGFVGALAFCVWIVIGHGLPPAWLALAFVIAVSNSLLELFSPRGTDDFTMATANALICWAFGALVL
jgi:dolichol kinase